MFKYLYVTVYMMKTSDMLVIGSVVAGLAYFISKNNSGGFTSWLNGFVNGGGSQPTGDVFLPNGDSNNRNINQTKAPALAATSSVKTASKSDLAKIDAAATANPDQTLYYPAFGIVTSGGKGYSTATPQVYADKAAATKATAASTTTLSTAPKITDSFKPEVLKGKLVF